MGKDKIRSIRLSEEIEEVIDQQIGSNFTEKLTNLITHCIFELPEKERQLERYQQMIIKEREKLQQITRTNMDLAGRARSLENQFKNMERELESILKQYSNTEL